MSKITLYEGPAPATPGTGGVVLYVLADGRFYFKADDGVEIPLKPTGVGSGDLLSDGSVPLTANWDVGPFTVTALRFVSDVPTGTAPFTVASTTLVANLNADQLDGQEGTYYENAALASQAEAEAGTENTKTMTALRTAQAIAVLAAGLQNKYDATAAPTATDDVNAGYSVGSFWIDITNDESYRCVDNTASAAVWVRTTLQTTDLAAVALSGDSDDLSEGSTNLLMTGAERTKLAGLPSDVLSASNNVQTGTTYTIQSSDNGKNIIFTNAAAIAVTLPDTLDTDFQCSIIQAGAGVPTVTPNTDTINGAGTGVAPADQWKAMYLTQYQAAAWLALL